MEKIRLKKRIDLSKLKFNYYCGTCKIHINSWRELKRCPACSGGL